MSVTDDYIAWAQLWCPAPLAPSKAPRHQAFAAYDAAELRLGDDAEGDDFLTRVLWLETAFRLAPLGWTIREVEDARWPSSHMNKVNHLLRELGVKRDSGACRDHGES